MAARTGMAGTIQSAFARDSSRPSSTQIVVAFAAIYLIWGSTYLGIRYAVETIPPLLMMGLRHLAAGSALYAWTRWRGVARPRLRDWKYPAIVGTALFVGGHGGLAWGEQTVPSGVAALLGATLPIWILILARVWSTERKFSRSALAGIALGFVGVAVLFGPDLLRHSGGLNLVGAAAVLLATFIWAAGTIYMRNVPMPASPTLSAAMQMMAGGASLVAAASITGETAHFHFAAVTARSWMALAYLAVFGSLVAFTAYTWLQRVEKPSRVATYAYVNPVVAVLVGWLVAGEPINALTVVAMTIILAAVALVNLGTKPEAKPRESPEPAVKHAEMAAD